MIRTPNVTYDLPGLLALDPAKLNFIKTGDTVKVSLGGDEVQVKIMHVAGEMCEGMVCAHPKLETLHGLKIGNQIRFQKKFIFNS